MPAVFVHGNPETAAIWEALLSQLDRTDVIALSPPGFGAPIPEGFDASANAYLEWLTAQLERIDGPIDLVGHDWGGVHVLRAVMSRPDLIRSWVSDAVGCLEPDYGWHPLALAWQTPDVGEQTVAAMYNTPRETLVSRLEELGMKGAAREVASAVDAEMGRCILALYRSAAQPMLKIWGEELPKAARRPGLAIIASGDAYTGGETLSRRAAERASAQVALLQGLGHWWMCEDPKRGADVLNAFFQSSAVLASR